MPESRIGTFGNFGILGFIWIQSGCFFSDVRKKGATTLVIYRLALRICGHVSKLKSWIDMQIRDSIQAHIAQLLFYRIIMTFFWGRLLPFLFKLCRVTIGNGTFAEFWQICSCLQKTKKNLILNALLFVGESLIKRETDELKKVRHKSG